jgi:hypothetical protein
LSSATAYRLDFEDTKKVYCRFGLKKNILYFRKSLRSDRRRRRRHSFQKVAVRVWRQQQKHVLRRRLFTMKQAVVSFNSDPERQIFSFKIRKLRYFLLSLLVRSCSTKGQVINSSSNNSSNSKFVTATFGSQKVEAKQSQQKYA